MTLWPPEHDNDDCSPERHRIPLQLHNPSCIPFIRTDDIPHVNNQSEIDHVLHLPFQSEANFSLRPSQSHKMQNQLALPEDMVFCFISTRTQGFSCAVTLYACIQRHVSSTTGYFVPVFPGSQVVRGEQGQSCRSKTVENAIKVKTVFENSASKRDSKIKLK